MVNSQNSVDLKASYEMPFLNVVKQATKYEDWSTYDYGDWSINVWSLLRVE